MRIEPTYIVEQREFFTAFYADFSMEQLNDALNEAGDKLDHLPHWLFNSNKHVTLSIEHEVLMRLMVDKHRQAA